MTITLENSIAEDLIKFKMNSVKKTVKNILESWKEDNVDEFIEKVISGKIPNAEMDAITIRDL
jgi:hypothetical protein